MGRRNRRLRGPLPAPQIEASERSLTDFAGLVPLFHFIEDVLQLPAALAKAVGSDPSRRRREYLVHRVLLAFVMATVGGVAKLAHLDQVAGDAVFMRFIRWTSWPCRKVFASALNLGAAARERLGRLVSDLGLRPVLGAESAVLDMDSTALVCFGEQKGARFGYTGKGRRRRRHFPLVASIAGARTVVLAKYRNGGGIDAEETIEFLSVALARTRAAMATGAKLMVRADGGFWSKALADWLLQQAVPFIISMPLQPAVKLMLHTVDWQRLDCDADIQVGAIAGADLGLDSRLRVVAVRRRLHDPKAPPPGKILPGCTRWRYQAFVTSILSWSLVDCWRFYCHRGDCERVFRDARQALGLGWLVSHDFNRNAVAFLLRMLALNVDRLFQRFVEERARKRGQRLHREGIIARQSWFYRTAGRLLRSSGAQLLRVRDNAAVLHRWRHYAPELVESST